MRKETRSRHIGYSFRLTARVLLYAPSHRQDNTYHSLCYTSRGALAGTSNNSMGPPHEGSIRQPIAPWANALTTELHLGPHTLEHAIHLNHYSICIVDIKYHEITKCGKYSVYNKHKYMDDLQSDRTKSNGIWKKTTNVPFCFQNESMAAFQHDFIRLCQHDTIAFHHDTIAFLHASSICMLKLCSKIKPKIPNYDNSDPL